jgi:hypothetical protein
VGHANPDTHRNRGITPRTGAALPTVSVPDDRSYDLVLYDVAVAASVGALVVLPIEKVR